MAAIPKAPNDQYPLSALSLENLKRYSDMAMKNLTDGRETIYRNFVAGGIAGAVSRSAVAPLERLKIMFMCGGERVRECGVRQALTNIYKHEGWHGFFRGNTANVARILPFSAIQLSTYPFFKSVLTLGDESNLTPFKRFWCGVLAGFAATFATYPMDFIRCRLSMQTEKHAVYRGMLDGIIKVAKQEGFFRLYTGLWPSLLGIIPYAGFQLSTYDITKAQLSKVLPKDDPMLVFIAGSWAGMVAQTAAFPIEMLRRRMQVRGFQLGGIVDPNATKLDHKVSIVHELKCVLKESGWKGLYRGLVPNYLKIIPAAGVNFVVYEYCKTAWDKHYSSSKAQL